MKTLGKLFLLFTVVTVVELYLLLKLAEFTNWWVTIATIILPGLLGAWLAKREGTKALRKIREALSLTREPTGALIDAAIVLVAGAFLITPGVLTDLTGLALLLPPVRKPVRAYIQRRIRNAIDRKIASGRLQFFSRGMGGFGSDPDEEPGRFDVIDANDIRPNR